MIVKSIQRIIDAQRSGRKTVRHDPEFLKLGAMLRKKMGNATYDFASDLFTLPSTGDDPYSYFKMMKEFPYRATEKWRGKTDKVSIIVQPLSKMDETTNQGAGVVVISQLIMFGILKPTTLRPLISLRNMSAPAPAAAAAAAAPRNPAVVPTAPAPVQYVPCLCCR